jgi:hypothetical protein
LHPTKDGAEPSFSTKKYVSVLEMVERGAFQIQTEIYIRV